MDPFDLMVSALALPLIPGRTKSTAVLILPGLHDWRMSQPRWMDYSRRVWVAGTAGDPSYSFAEVKDLIQGTPDELQFQGEARHTPDQMTWAVELLNVNMHISQLGISTAAYHNGRCVLTFIKEWTTNGDGRPLRIGALPTINPNPIEGFSFIQSYDKSGSVREEALRIDKYLEKGHVATAEEFASFVRNMPE